MERKLDQRRSTADTANIIATDLIEDFGDREISVIVLAALAEADASSPQPHGVSRSFNMDFINLTKLVDVFTDYLNRSVEALSDDASVRELMRLYLKTRLLSDDSNFDTSDYKSYKSAAN